jgi:DNA-directed RNA polymerase
LNLIKTIERAEKSQWRAINSFGFGLTIEGAALVESHYDLLSAHVKKQFRSRPRSLPEPLWLVIKGLDPDKLSVAVLRALMHSIWLRKPKERSPALKATLLIGRAIRRECLHRKLLRSDPGLLKKVEKAAAREPDLRRRERMVERMMKAASFKTREWTDRDLAVAGNWALETVLCALPEVFILGKGGAPLIYEEAVLPAAALAEAVLLKHPIYSPHTTPPKPWTGWENEDGATFVRNARSENDIKLAMRKKTMARHVDGINNLQAVAWTINERVSEVIEALDPCDKVLKLKGKSGRGVGGEELLKRDMETARQLCGAPFWTPMNCDWRGRAYTLPHFGFWREDRVRALFLFNDSQPIGIRGLYWLKLHVANCGDFGKISKRPLDERVRWTEANISKILRVATQPDNFKWWREAKQSFQFLAACFELATALAVGPAFLTRLPIGFDGSANGTQHLAAMTRAENEGRLVNLIPQAEPSDLYGVIADKLNDQLRKRFHRYANLCLSWDIDRDLVKRPTMTHPYSATRVGMREQLEEELKGRGISPDFKAVHWLAGQVLDTVEDVLKRPARAMDFMKRCAELMAEQNKAVTVISPTGLPLSNRYSTPRTKRIKLWLIDKTVRRVMADGFKPKILKRDVKNGISPNITHMVDSSHLMMTVNACVAEGITNVAAIHDSFNCLASQADRFNAIIREQFVRLHTEHDILADIRKVVVRELGEAPSIPERGTLDLNEILNADFAFS